MVEAQTSVGPSAGGADVCSSSRGNHSTGGGGAELHRVGTRLGPVVNTCGVTRGD